MEIREQILRQLSQIEREHNIRIPIAIESGSRAWGFASPDSDYDCRFLYVHPRDWYLSVFEGKDTIEYTPDAVFDVGGWDVHKVIQHLVKSNAVMLEWLSSPVIYRMDERVRDELWKLGEAFFNPVAVCWHYLSMARNKLAEIELAAPVKEAIARLLKEKETAAEGFLMPKNEILLRYFREESAWAEEWLGTLHHDKNRDYEQANQVFRNIIEMVNSDG